MVKPQISAELRRDDATARIVHLRHTTTRLGAQRRAAERREVVQTALLFLSGVVCGVKRQIAVIDRLQFATFVCFNVATRENPMAPELCR